VESEFFENWVTQLRKGMLELCVLNAIHSGVTYGYEIVRRLREVDSLVITEGTIYPILSRLKREEFVQTAIEESPGGPPRKVYRITEKGRRQLEQMNRYWRRVEAGIDAIQKSPIALAARG
jgi:PadR family transcriptional regulator PadR